MRVRHLLRPVHGVRDERLCTGQRFSAHGGSSRPERCIRAPLFARPEKTGAFPFLFRLRFCFWFCFCFRFKSFSMTVS